MRLIQIVGLCFWALEAAFASDVLLVDCADGQEAKGIRTFFAKSGCTATRTDVKNFIERYTEEVRVLNLTSCHAVYKLLGVLGAQLERSFRDVALTLLDSYHTNRSLLFEWTGYQWGQEVAQGENAEVLRALTLAKDWRQCRTDEAILPILQTHDKFLRKSFFARSVMAAFAKEWKPLTAKTWQHFSVDPNKKDKTFLCLSYVLLQQNKLARLLYLRRYKAVEAYPKLTDPSEIGLLYMMCEMNGSPLSWSSNLLACAYPFLVVESNRKYAEIKSQSDNEVERQIFELNESLFLTDAIVEQYLQRHTIGYHGG